MRETADTEMRSNRTLPRLCRPLVLIGLMGAGKTSVGSKLAARLGVEAVDSDAEIEKAAALTIPEIFERYGERHFRAGERRVLARLLGAGPRGISAGGGAFMDAETRSLIRNRAVSVWLKADLDLLVTRTTGRTHRPLLNRGDPRQILSALMAERHPIYADADVTVTSLADQTHNQTAERIGSALIAHGKAFEPTEG